MKSLKSIGALALALAAGSATGAELTVQMHKLEPQGAGEAIGSVTLKDTEYGLMLIPHLSGLQSGAHGFHIHAKADCGAASKNGKQIPGLAAGGHFDPSDTGKHEGPVGNGHLGDLPVLLVNSEGTANLPVFAPRLKTADVSHHALMIHADGDNYSDQPQPLGGGGSREACGVIGGGGD